MIYFFADNHYDTRAGRVLCETLGDAYDLSFHEDDWREMERDGFAERCSLLVLHMIGDTCGVAHPSDKAEKQVRAYAEEGGDFLLLHGSSAAFWRWDWWRPIVGWRWVRPDDPDGLPPSTHPVRPYAVRVIPGAHLLCDRLRDMTLGEDEIYINLQQACPTTVLMETTTDEGTFPQCYTCASPWGGRVVGFLPGHRRESLGNESLLHNILTLLTYLIELRASVSAC